MFKLRRDSNPLLSNTNWALLPTELHARSHKLRVMQIFKGIFPSSPARVIALFDFQSAGQRKFKFITQIVIRMHTVVIRLLMKQYNNLKPEINPLQMKFSCVLYSLEGAKQGQEVCLYTIQQSGFCVKRSRTTKS